MTPDEERYVPEGVKQIINLGQRTCSADTMIEAAMRLGLSELLEEEGVRNYQESVCANTYYFDQMFSRSRRLESQFDMLMDVLDQGVVAVDEKEIFTPSIPWPGISPMFWAMRPSISRAAGYFLIFLLTSA